MLTFLSSLMLCGVTSPKSIRPSSAGIVKPLLCSDSEKSKDGWKEVWLSWRGEGPSKREMGYRTRPLHEVYMKCHSHTRMCRMGKIGMLRGRSRGIKTQWKVLMCPSEIKKMSFLHGPHTREIIGGVSSWGCPGLDRGVSRVISYHPIFTGV